MMEFRETVRKAEAGQPIRKSDWQQALDALVRQGMAGGLDYHSAVLSLGRRDASRWTPSELRDYCALEKAHIVPDPPPAPRPPQESEKIMAEIERLALGREGAEAVRKASIMDGPVIKAGMVDRFLNTDAGRLLYRRYTDAQTNELRRGE